MGWRVYLCLQDTADRLRAAIMIAMTMTHCSCWSYCNSCEHVSWPGGVPNSPPPKRCCSSTRNNTTAGPSDCWRRWHASVGSSGSTWLRSSCSSPTGTDRASACRRSSRRSWRTGSVIFRTRRHSPLPSSVCIHSPYYTFTVSLSL